LYLPFTDSESAASEPRPELISDIRGAGTILLVEDDELVRKYGEGQLRGLGYTVIAVQNGVEAMDIIRRNVDIDLLFTDVIMPGGINGYELGDAALKVRPQLKVLYSSGYTDAAVAHQIHKAPNGGMLSKPYGRVDLARKIRAALSGSDE
jgi:CheY-like chemotaxis protein